LPVRLPVRPTAATTECRSVNKDAACPAGAAASAVGGAAIYSGSATVRQTGMQVRACQAETQQGGGRVQPARQWRAGCRLYNGRQKGRAERR